MRCAVMMRTRQPAGAVTNQLYLAMDDLADQARLRVQDSPFTGPQLAASHPRTSPLLPHCTDGCS